LHFCPPVRPFSCHTPLAICSRNSGFTLLGNALDFFFVFGSMFSNFKAKKEQDFQRELSLLKKIFCDASGHCKDA